MDKNAIISVYDKTDLDIISKYLIKKKYTIYSTGGTSDFLKKHNIPHIEISKYTKQKEILGGASPSLPWDLSAISVAPLDHCAQLLKGRVGTNV